MVYPKPVPSLTKEEAAQFREAIREFEPPVGMEDDLAKHREALQEGT